MLEQHALVLIHRDNLRSFSRQLEFAALLVSARCTFEFIGDEEDDVSSQAVYGDTDYLVFR